MVIIILSIVLQKINCWGTNIVPGARQSLDPKFPTLNGPFTHNKPSELDKAMKKRKPIGYFCHQYYPKLVKDHIKKRTRETCQEMGSMVFDVTL